jgi:hypothetical protein
MSSARRDANYQQDKCQAGSSRKAAKVQAICDPEATLRVVSRQKNGHSGIAD